MNTGKLHGKKTKKRTLDFDKICPKLITAGVAIAYIFIIRWMINDLWCDLTPAVAAVKAIIASVAATYFTIAVFATASDMTVREVIRKMKDFME